MLTGLIFGLIVVLWVVYLVPRSTLRDAKGGHRVDPAALDAVGESMQVVRDCRSNDELPDSGASISTPLQRRAVKYQIKRANQIAQRRRRIVLLVNTIILVATIVLPFVSPFSHWLTLGGFLLFVTGLALSAYSVQTMRRAKQRLLDELVEASNEHTVELQIEIEHSEFESHERSVELTEELENIQSLLAPLPVTPSTYISKPLLPRSVRTIDLSAPLPPQRPVTVDAPESSAVDLPRAVGE